MSCQRICAKSVLKRLDSLLEEMETQIHHDMDSTGGTDFLDGQYDVVSKLQRWVTYEEER